MEDSSRNARDRVPVLPTLLLAAAATLWLQGGTALVLRTVPDSPGRDPGVLSTGLVFAAAFLIATTVFRNRDVREGRWTRMVGKGLAGFLAFFALAFLLEGPQTFRPEAMPIKLVPATAVLLFNVVAALLLRTSGRSDGPAPVA